MKTKVYFEIQIDNGFITEIRKSYESAIKRREHWEKQGARVRIIEMTQTILGPMGVVVF